MLKLAYLGAVAHWGGHTPFQHWLGKMCCSGCTCSPFEQTIETNIIEINIYQLSYNCFPLILDSAGQQTGMLMT